MLGYDRPLYILPFDHKTSFITKMFAWDYDTLTSQQRSMIETMRMITYEGFLHAIGMGIPKETAAFLTDEEFGGAVLKKAKADGYMTLLTTEKSGQEVFTFDYGADFGVHINAFSPTFTKALIRYNPGADEEANKKQLENLHPLVEFSKEKGYKFLIEPLLPATEAQLAAVGGDKTRYDTEVRPDLTVTMMEQLQEAGIEPDIWKIEGFSEKVSYEKAIAQARSGGREAVSIVILGRGGTIADVEQWFIAGRDVPGVNGFAVGRTIFWEPLEKFHKEEISREQAATAIGENFYHFYQIFTQK